jgi:hypothetical protein
MERRDLMKLLATLPVGAFALSHEEVATVAEHVHALGLDEQGAQGKPRAAFTPKFFQPLEWRTVRVLADIVIPRDARSGSATDAGVPEFIDFAATFYPGHQPRLREGLGWINAEARARFGAAFPDATPAQRIAIVEDIAWPAKAKPAHRSGVQFFNAFRDLCASGFYTTRMGVKDLGYAGNVPLAQWTGCPAAANRHLGT